jgi:hypothetical protein
MNSEPIHTTPATVAPESAGQIEGQAPETGATQQAKHTVSPYTLVPALTLIALQFLKDEPGIIDLIINSAGSGQHRPGAK